MKKKLIVMILIVAMLPAMIFASSDFLQLGLNVGYKPTLDTLIDEPKSDWKDYFKTEYFAFAPELKINLFFIDLDATAYFNFSENAVLIDTQLGADLYFKLFNTLKISAGAGINMPFTYDKRDTTWYINDQPVDGTTALDAFKNSFLAYRAGVGFDFGRFNMMINYSVPTNGTFVKPDFTPNWKHGQFSLGLLIDLF